MSKELEALERFNSCRRFYVAYGYYNDFLNDELYRKDVLRVDDDYLLIKQALERNEPMKPIDVETFKISRIGSFIEGTCPTCHVKHLSPDFNYCLNCGQRLDWKKQTKEKENER